MAYLFDTSILARLANTTDAQHAVAAGAVLELHRRGEVLHLTAQVLVEFRNVATHLVTVKGLGLSTVDTEAQATFNVGHFVRMAGLGPGLVVVDPASV
jgi:hypothetical protein